MKRRIVTALETADSLLDRIPYWNRDDRRWRSCGGWGCRLGLAMLSARLDERWATGVWARS